MTNILITLETSVGTAYEYRHGTTHSVVSSMIFDANTFLNYKTWCQENLDVEVDINIYGYDIVVSASVINNIESYDIDNEFAKTITNMGLLNDDGLVSFFQAIDDVKYEQYFEANLHKKFKKVISDSYLYEVFCDLCICDEEIVKDAPEIEYKKDFPTSFEEYNQWCANVYYPFIGVVKNVVKELLGDNTLSYITLFQELRKYNESL